MKSNNIDNLIIRKRLSAIISNDIDCSNKNIKNTLNIHFFNCIQATDNLRQTPEMQKEKAAYSRFQDLIAHFFPKINM